MRMRRVPAEPLTPEEVYNKSFTQVRMRAGYDQDEVDDFLDQVVMTMRAMRDGINALQQRRCERCGGDVH